jgi:hypothetical protein
MDDETRHHHLRHEADLHEQDDVHDDEDGLHENVLQQVLLHLLQAEAGDLEELCEDAGVPVLRDQHGQPVYLTSVHSYADAGIMTLDKGVWITMSDGAEFGFTVSIGHRPHGYMP